MNYTLNPVVSNLLIGVGAILIVVALLFTLLLGVVWIIIAIVVAALTISVEHIITKTKEVFASRRGDDTNIIG